jgi:osmotically inducible lipoprotein OsmB
LIDISRPPATRRRLFAGESNNMKKLFLIGISVLTAVDLLAGCASNAGTGAAVGAGTGAVVAGPVGAAVGAGTGAVVGAAVDSEQGH